MKVSTNWCYVRVIGADYSVDPFAIGRFVDMRAVPASAVGSRCEDGGMADNRRIHYTSPVLPSD